MSAPFVLPEPSLCQDFAPELMEEQVLGSIAFQADAAMQGLLWAVVSGAH